MKDTRIFSYIPYLVGMGFLYFYVNWIIFLFLIFALIFELGEAWTLRNEIDNNRLAVYNSMVAIRVTFYALVISTIMSSMQAKDISAYERTVLFLYSTIQK